MGGQHVQWPMSLHDLARRQFGVVERRQVAGLAPSRSAARTELSRSHWVDLGLGVFRLRGAPVTEWQHSMAAILQAGPGAVVSHVSAAGFWGVPGMPTRPAHVTTMRNSNRRRGEGAIAHRARRLANDQVTALDGLPITRPERVPFDLAHIGMSTPRIERAVDGSAPTANRFVAIVLPHASQTGGVAEQVVQSPMFIGRLQLPGKLCHPAFTERLAGP